MSRCIGISIEQVLVLHIKYKVHSFSNESRQR